MVAGAGLRGRDGRALPGRPDRLRAALQQHDAVRGVAVQGRATRAVAEQRPFDVLGYAVVLLDPSADQGERAGLVVGQAGRPSQGGGHGLGGDPLAVWRK